MSTPHGKLQIWDHEHPGADAKLQQMLKTLFGEARVREATDPKHGRYLILFCKPGTPINVLGTLDTAALLEYVRRALGSLELHELERLDVEYCVGSDLGDAIYVLYHEVTAARGCQSNTGDSLQ